MKRATLMSAALVLMFGGVGQAIAGPIYSQALDNSSDGGGFSEVLGQQNADNFTLTSSGTVGGVQWYGSYFHNGTAPIGSSPQTSLQFDIRFFADNGGLPATNPFYDTQVTATATDTHMTTPDFGGGRSLSVLGEFNSFSSPGG
jgi:hypothetical protein